MVDLQDKRTQSLLLNRWNRWPIVVVSLAPFCVSHCFNKEDTVLCQMAMQDTVSVQSGAIKGKEDGGCWSSILRMDVPWSIVHPQLSVWAANRDGLGEAPSGSRRSFGYTGHWVQHKRGEEPCGHWYLGSWQCLSAPGCDHTPGARLKSSRTNHCETLKSTLFCYSAFSCFPPKPPQVCNKTSIITCNDGHKLGTEEGESWGKEGLEYFVGLGLLHYQVNLVAEAGLTRRSHTSSQILNHPGIHLAGSVVWAKVCCDVLTKRRNSAHSRSTSTHNPWTSNLALPICSLNTHTPEHATRMGTALQHSPKTRFRHL